MTDDAITCDGCGSLLKRRPQPETGVKGIRQGRSSAGAQPGNGSSRIEPKGEIYAKRDMARDVPTMYREDRPRERRRGVERFAEDAGRPQSRRGIPRVTETEVRKLRIRQDKVRPVKKHMINWMLVLVGAVLVFIIGLIGGMFYLNQTSAGQLVLARMGRDASAQAYWQVGEEYMNRGQVGQAIEAFKKADEMNPDNVDGLLSLAAAYEAYGLQEEAMTLYVRLYEDVSPERPEAYRNQIRLLIMADKKPEAAVLMKLAYEKTGLQSFKQQRDETLPKMPETDLAAGRYTEEKQVNLESPQDYDILYIIGDGEFTDKEAAKPYEGTILLKEGTQRLRAVAVSNDLMSDPLDVTYVIALPSPDAPKASLAPDTYERAQRVRLRYPGKDSDITMYYTLDGTMPDAKTSPRYTGEPINLPGGRVTLRAIAVNSKGKVSNTMEVGYKINGVKFQAMYAAEDSFDGFTLMSTTREAFIRDAGEPISRETVSYTGIADECQKLVYSWGYSIFAPINGDWRVVEVYQTDNQFAAPRKTSIGSALDDVVGKFRDMKQPESQNGNRSLYYDGDSFGIIEKLSGQQISIKYSFISAEGYRYLLKYDLSNGIVTAVTHRYEP